jgi:hypothetical protein
MSASPSTLHSLRQLLAERFPPAPRTRTGGLATGVPGVDRALGGGLPAGLLTELVSAAPSSGGQLVFTQALAAARAQRRRVALVDGADAFDPAAFAADDLRHLVWVRCRQLGLALAAAELLVRDGNFGLVALDLRGASRAEQRRLAAAAWYRLQRAAEQGEAAVLVQTTEPTVPAVAHRLLLEQSLPLAGQAQGRAELLAALAPVIARQAAAREALAG